jgi:hypothetical protein
MASDVKAMLFKIILPTTSDLCVSRLNLVADFSYIQLTNPDKPQSYQGPEISFQ